MPRKKMTTSSETFANRQLPDGRRQIKLRRNEREALVRRQRAEAAAALFLDLETSRTWAQIGQELELSPAQLRDLTKSEEFDQAYAQLFVELGHDPRYRAAQGAISDMLPIAVTQLKTLLTNARTPAGVKLKAIERVLALNGLTNPEIAHSDRAELAEFLTKHGMQQINIQQIVNPPQEYLDQYDQLVAPEVIEGEVREITP